MTTENNMDQTKEIQEAYALLAKWHAAAIEERPDLKHFASLERNEDGEGKHWWATVRSYSTSEPPDAIRRRAAGIGTTPTEAVRQAVATWRSYT